jgi:NADH:ubiquinone oxidoreductase subunit F (NADH-binding)
MNRHLEPQQARDESPRLLAAADPSWGAHLAAHGELPPAGGLEALAAAAAAAGLAGRGGAGFPTARKLLSLRGTAPLVIANGSEGDSFSAKDAMLLARAPWLVLEGLRLLAEAVGSRRTVVRAPAEALAGIRAADPGQECSEATGTFVEGEASAVVAAVTGRPALPSFHALPLSQTQPGRPPALVLNVETLAVLALAWRTAARGAPPPSTRLYTVSGDGVGGPLPDGAWGLSALAPGQRWVIEADAGASAAEVLEAAGLDASRLAATGASVLVGGRHGHWLGAEQVAGGALRVAGSASPRGTGGGMLHVVGAERCPVDLVAELAQVLAEDSAGQCGPCVFGLPALAASVGALARGTGGSPHEVEELCQRVAGRGACHHPDGAVGFLRSSLAALGEEFALHARGSCSALHGYGARARSGLALTGPIPGLAQGGNREVA